MDREYERHARPPKQPIRQAISDPECLNSEHFVLARAQEAALCSRQHEYDSHVKYRGTYRFLHRLFRLDAVLADEQQSDHDAADARHNRQVTADLRRRHAPVARVDARDREERHVRVQQHHRLPVSR